MRQPGSNIFISDGTGTGAVPIAALTDTTFTIDGKAVDITTRDDAGWQTLLAGAGVVKVTLKGNGIVDNGTEVGVLASRAAAQSINPYTLNWADARLAAGGFQLTQFEAKGTYDKEQNYSFQLESSGPIAFSGT